MLMLWSCRGSPTLPQTTFREVLTLLAVCDVVFITTATVTFGLPQLSQHWKVGQFEQNKTMTRSFFKLLYNIDMPQINNEPSLICLLKPDDNSDIYMLRSQIMSSVEYILGKKLFHHKFTQKIDFFSWSAN